MRDIFPTTPTCFPVDLNSLPNKEKIKLIREQHVDFPDLELMIKNGQIHSYDITFTSDGYATVIVNPIRSLDFIFLKK